MLEINEDVTGEPLLEKERILKETGGEYEVTRKGREFVVYKISCKNCPHYSECGKLWEEAGFDLKEVGSKCHDHPKVNEK